MSGTKAGAIKTRDTILETRPDHFRVIGKIGGQAHVPKGFAITGKGQEAGRIGGSRSSRKIIFTDAQINEMKSMRIHGMMWREIAEEFGYHKATVRRAYKEHVDKSE